MDWLSALKHFFNPRSWRLKRHEDRCESSETPLADFQPSTAAHGAAAKVAENSSGPGKDAHAFPYATELTLAESFLERSQFGTVGREVHHFTHQMKVEARHYFDKTDDISHYTAADGMQWFAFLCVVFMRVLTLLTFVLFAWYAASRIFVPLATQEITNADQALEAPSQTEPRKDWAWRSSPVDYFLKGIVSTDCPTGLLCSKGWHATADIVFVGFLLFLARIGLRGVFLYILIGPDVRLKRAELRNAHAELVRECERVAENISEIVADAVWPDWAKKKGLVSLWYAIRADFLDRYFTTCLWKLRRTFVVAEWGFRSAKVLAAVVIFAWIAHYDPYSGSIPPLHLGPLWTIGLTGAFIAAAVLGWDYFFRAPNNFITIIFQEQEGKASKVGSSSRAGYFDALASQYGRMASLVINYKQH